MNTTEKFTVVVGCDHAACDMKSKVIAHIQENGYRVIDVGTYSSDSCNYPDYAHAACTKIQSGEATLGILICGTGIGMSMAANRVSGVRAAATSSAFGAKYTRAHNNANVLCLGERILGEGEALELVDLFITTPFDTENPRHKTRVEKIDAIDKKYKGE